jgi:hypothetical protein
VWNYQLGWCASEAQLSFAPVDQNEQSDSFLTAPGTDAVIMLWSVSFLKIMLHLWKFVSHVNHLQGKLQVDPMSLEIWYYAINLRLLFSKPESTPCLLSDIGTGFPERRQLGLKLGDGSLAWLDRVVYTWPKARVPRAIQSRIVKCLMQALQDAG